jgi:hypothetical protein
VTGPVGRWLVAIGAVVALAGTFLPWLSSGTVDRSSYDLFDLVERLGFSPDGLVGLALRLWPLVPLALVLSVVAQTPQIWARTGALVGAGLPLLTVIYVGSVCAAVIAAPDVALFRVRGGLWITIAGVGAMLVGAGLIVFRRGRPTDRARSAPA